MESEVSAENEQQEFKEVSSKRKRKARGVEGDMETEGGEAASTTKRPSFPPVDASTTLVRGISLNI